MKSQAPIILLLSALLAIAPATTTQAQAGMMASHQRTAAKRLPQSIKPQSYDIRLKPDLVKQTFTGTETITLKVDDPTTQIWLHALNLKIGVSTITDSAGKQQPLTPKDSAAEEMVSFTAPSTLQPGIYKLRTAFSGNISDKLTGLYKANFTDRSGKTQLMAATQFEPADARRMIPCFDEPDFKAKFKLTLQVDPRFNAVSNAPEIKETTAGGVKTIEFEPTQPMSSYLLALVIGEMDATPAVMVQGTPIRVWSAKGMGHLGTFARDEAAKILPFMNGYFGIPYPWKKLDLIAVPEFEAGAMENPGCITFRESLLLIDPKTAATSSQKACTGVTAHEMAHLWFGDLVTMKWWDDIWLNEAFATWMATKAVNAVHPEWEEWKAYSWERNSGMGVDSLQATRTIHSEVKSPEQTHEMFDQITYQKGAAVLRMLERYVAEPVFQKGVHQYLQAHEFGNATTNDLWDGIGSASGAPVRDIMQGWVHQPGYPLITAVEPADRPGTVNLAQQRFYLDAAHPATTEKWMVPIGIRRIDAPVPQTQQSNADQKFLLQDKESGAPTGVSATTPIIVNAGGVGFYRTRYDEPASQRIIAQPLNHLDPSERIAIIDDAGALMTSGMIPVTRYLDLISHYKEETDDSVWGAIISDLNFLDRFIDEPARPAFEKFVRQQLAAIFARLTWQVKPTDTPQIRELRGQVIGSLGTIGQDPAVIAEARKRIAQYAKDKNSLDRDLVGPVSRIVAYNGGAADFSRFRQFAQKAATPEERVRNTFLLSDFRSPELATQTLNLALSKQIRLQDSPGLISGLIGNRKVQDQAWRFVTTNWSKIRAIFPEDMVPHLVSSAGSFSRPNQLADLKSFLATHSVPSGKSASARALERASINVRFREQSAAELNKWMQSHFGV